MKDSTKLLTFGGLCLIGGLFALANPLLASLASEIFIGWSFLIAGVAGLFAAFRLESNRIFAALTAIILLVTGVFLVANPLAGLLALTAAIAFMFLISGITRVTMALSMRGQSGFWIFLLSGVISVLLGLALFANFPLAAASVLGVFLGVELIMISVTLLSMGWQLRTA